jgi:hypothetical protein
MSYSVNGYTVSFKTDAHSNNFILPEHLVTSENITGLFMLCAVQGMVDLWRQKGV